MAMRHLAIRDLADLLVAAAFAPAAFAFDVLDGRIARWRQTSSALGRELDSLADVISFGVAPAALAFACGADRPLGRGHPRLLRLLRRLAPGALQRHRRVAVGGKRQGQVLRGHADPDQRAAHRGPRLGGLAGTHRRRSFGGAWTLLGADLHPFALLFALSGTLMVSKTLRIPKPLDGVSAPGRGRGYARRARPCGCSWVASISVATERSSGERDKPESRSACSRRSRPSPDGRSRIACSGCVRQAARRARLSWRPARGIGRRRCRDRARLDALEQPRQRDQRLEPGVQGFGAEAAHLGFFPPARYLGLEAKLRPRGATSTLGPPIAPRPGRIHCMDFAPRGARRATARRGIVWRRRPRRCRPRRASPTD